MCYPEIPSNDIIFGKRTLFGQILQRAVSDYQMLISSGLFLDQNLRLLTESTQKNPILLLVTFTDIQKWM